MTIKVSPKKSPKRSLQVPKCWKKYTTSLSNTRFVYLSFSLFHSLVASKMLQLFRGIWYIAPLCHINFYMFSSSLFCPDHNKTNSIKPLLLYLCAIIIKIYSTFCNILCWQPIDWPIYVASDMKLSLVLVVARNERWRYTLTSPLTWM